MPRPKMPRIVMFAAFLFVCVAQGSGIASAEAAVHDGRADAFIARAGAMRLYEREEWRRLVHYRKKRSRWVSEADNAGFFIASDGKTNPESELIATLRAGFRGDLRSSGMPDVPEMSVRCQFPARWKWLMEELGGTGELMRDDFCQHLQDFRDKVNARSATLVFSSYYVNNPSTVFGHLLLRLNKQESKRRGPELLDTGVNYAAVTTTTNPFLYAFMGMTGFFRGTFTALPYYYKVREYSDAESRDLWEYDLSLGPKEIERLVDHIWEMGSTYFDYYYFDENCAYHLLAVLETAAPRLKLLDRMPFYVLPVDAVKAVTDELGLVSRVHYRPSTARQLNERFTMLTTEEREIFLRVRNAEEPAAFVAKESLSQESAARVLDAVLDDIDHRYFRELVFETDPKAARRKQNVLLNRAKLPSGGEVSVAMSERERPDRGHASGRWWIAGGAVENTTGRSFGVLDAELRFALHDLFDPSEGYPPYAIVEFWRVQGRIVPEARKFELQSFSLFTVSSLSPLSRLEKPLSWRVNAGAARIRDRRCDGCLAATGEALAGFSLAPNQDLLGYLLLGPVAETSDGFSGEKWLVSGASRVGFRWRLAQGLRFGAEGEWRRVFDRESFDRFSGRAVLRWNLEREGRPWFSLEADHTSEATSRATSRDWFLRYIRYF